MVTFYILLHDSGSFVLYYASYLMMENFCLVLNSSPLFKGTENEGMYAFLLSLSNI